jgi:hypothetical protein
MLLTFKTIALAAATTTAAALLTFTKPEKIVTPTPTNVATVSNKPATQKIQAAILLDVSGSMDGLIEQAKAQLWNMVSTMGKVKCTGDAAPQIEIALYEYGRDGNDAKKGYVKQINSFITSLDSLSENLFSLTTNGGEEYCGQVIKTSINELKWDAAPENYKVIFIAGNEDFLQGSVKYIEACNAAKQKGIIVNTIYCGDRMQGIQEHWDLNTECGNGSFTNINQNASTEDIPTPYDSLLISMNSTLNGTYVAYGFNGAAKYSKQQRMDEVNVTASKTAAIKRTKAKGNSAVYKNTEWDLVDRYKNDSVGFAKLSYTEMPDSLQSKTKEEIKAIVLQKSNERNAAQQQITELNKKRDAFIAAEKAKRANNATENTLETEVEKMIKEQVKRFNMRME